ncbi:MAG: transcriptional regulator with GAF, ATPase, and Fis domain, partial [Bradymonadia bacterium]
ERHVEDDENEAKCAAGVMLRFPVEEGAIAVCVERVVAGEATLIEALPVVADASAAELALLFADIAWEREPARVVAGLERCLRRADSSTLSGLALVLPDDERDPWSSIAVVGDVERRGTLNSLLVSNENLLHRLSQGEDVVVTRGGAAQLFLPLRTESTLVGIVTWHGDEGRDARRALVNAARPALVRFAAFVPEHAHREAIEEENRYFRDRQRRHYLHKALAQQSEAMQRVHQQLETLIQSRAPVVMTGEAGTGKELLARALHHLSARASGMLIKQHCGALSEDALDYELFGHAPPQGQSSAGSRRGVLELADRGTVFLEEVHALSPRLQMKLHRVIAEGEIFRIGEARARDVDVRIVVATHLDIMSLADAGTFRRDLAIALTRNELHVPSLRERREDIAPLIRIFVQSFAKRYRRSARHVEPQTLAWLQGLQWPGNVRELQTAIESAMLQVSPDKLQLERSDFEHR